MNTSSNAGNRGGGYGVRRGYEATVTPGSPSRGENDSRGRSRVAPTRIESFCRAHQHRHDRRTSARLLLLPTLYVTAFLIYGRTLLFGLGGGPFSEPSAAVEPRSLADVVLINAEGVYTARKVREELQRRRAEARRELNESKKRLQNGEGGEEKEGGEENNLEPPVDGTDNLQPGESEPAGEGGNSTTKKSDKESPDDYLTRLAKYQTKRTPTRVLNGVRGGTGTTSSQQKQGDDSFVPLFLMIGMCSLVRIALTTFVSWHSEQGDDEPSDAEAALGHGRFAPLLTQGAMRRATILRRRARAEHSRRQFQAFVDRLNDQRRQNGEGNISADALRLVASNRDFNGDDYEDLLQFRDESGPAIGSFLSSMGLTRVEIDRLPSRVIAPGDDLLCDAHGPGGGGDVGSSSSNNNAGTEGGEDAENQAQKCTVCLDAYQVGDTIRTIPCFHSFHKHCIDPWLMIKSECPICKHSAMG